METKTITPRQCNELANSIEAEYPHVYRELAQKASLAAEVGEVVTLTSETHLAAWSIFTGSGIGNKYN